MIRFILFPAICLSFLFTLNTLGQQSEGGAPASFRYSTSGDNGDQIALTPPAIETLVNEDEQYPSPFRFAINIPSDISPGNSGSWTNIPGGGKIWRVTVSAKGALALTAYFDHFRIPAGGRLFLYNADRSYVIGAFTEMNNSRDGNFATELIPGDQLIMEYDQPAGSNEIPVIHANEIAWAYRGVEFLNESRVNRGISGPCEVNVVCPEGNDWKNQKRGIVRIQVKKSGSSFWCSGSVVNNTRYDRTPYVLTADHCGAGASPSDIGQWIFYFNYEATACINPPDPIAPKSITGAVMKAHGGNSGLSGSDFFLVLLNQNIPETYNVYFNGWSRTDSSSPSGVTIHHPEGDVKKISTYDKPLVTSTWNGNAFLSHWKVKWIETSNGHGVTEGGSSGSPIFDNKGHIVGTLTGGDSKCDSASLGLPDYYGKFAWSWDKNGTDSASVLKYWLDPDSTGIKTLNGIGVGIKETASSLAIKVFPNPFTDILNIEVQPSTGPGTLVIHDLSGRLLFSEPVPGTHQSVMSVGLKDLTDGLYIMELVCTQGVRVVKIIKQEN